MSCTKCGRDEDTRGGLCFGCAMSMDAKANGGTNSRAAQIMKAASEGDQAGVLAAMKLPRSQPVPKRTFLQRLFGGGR